MPNVALILCFELDTDPDISSIWDWKTPGKEFESEGVTGPDLASFFFFL